MRSVKNDVRYKASGPVFTRVFKAVPLSVSEECHGVMWDDGRFDLLSPEIELALIRWENDEEQRAMTRRQKAPKGECKTCDAERLDERQRCRVAFHPPHDASPRCESGGRNHCSCDVCF